MPSVNSMSYSKMEKCTCKTLFLSLKQKILELLSQQELVKEVVSHSKSLTGSQSQRSGTRINCSVYTRQATERATPSPSSSLHSLIKLSLSSMMASLEDTSLVLRAWKTRMAKRSVTSQRLLQLKNRAANMPNSSSLWAEKNLRIDLIKLF